MLRKEEYAVIKPLDQRGIYLKDIDAELDVHPRPASHAQKRGSAAVPARVSRAGAPAGRELELPRAHSLSLPALVFIDRRHSTGRERHTYD
jgi:hypothetical protein